MASATKRLSRVVQHLTSATVAALDKEALRKKYAEERDKRLRNDGNGQYITLEGQLSYYRDDPYSKPEKREPKMDHVTFAYVGGGFAGLCTAAGLVEAGVDASEVRIVEKGGDVGGTWYWNRYPGAMCDTAAIIYMPLLEETRHMPTEKYAHGPEILEQSQKIAKKYGLYEKALLHTEVKELTWEDEHSRWRVKTNRGDSFTASFLGVGTGPFVSPKLPGIPGIHSFKGHTFHTSRWDYEYTGGSPLQGGELTAAGGGSKIGSPLSKLGDKRVAIIGTGATAVQCIPHLAAACKELLVFQRTPSSVDVRGNMPTDPAEFAKIQSEPGWQRKWMNNFCAVNTGRMRPGDEDLVKDGWTDLTKRILTAIAQVPRDQRAPKAMLAAFENADNEKMSEIRARADDVVHDPATAEGLKAWYRQLCKRPTFHDEYLQSYNRPNVTLVDVSGSKGVEMITESGLKANGREYEVDCIIYGSGFEVGGDLARKNGFEIFGQNGETLTEHWTEGMRSLHGTHIHGFPNLFVQSLAQNAGYSVNVPHNYVEQGKAVGAVVAHALKHKHRRVELSKEEEEKWVQLIMKAPPMAMGPAAGDNACTPGYYNNEGQAMDDHFKSYRPFPSGALPYFGFLKKWRSDGKFSGLSFS